MKRFTVKLERVQSLGVHRSPARGSLHAIINIVDRVDVLPVRRWQHTLVGIVTTLAPSRRRLSTFVVNFHE